MKIEFFAEDDDAVPLSFEVAFKSVCSAAECDTGFSPISPRRAADSGNKRRGHRVADVVCRVAQMLVRDGVIMVMATAR